MFFKKVKDDLFAFTKIIFKVVSTTVIATTLLLSSCSCAPKNAQKTQSETTESTVEITKKSEKEPPEESVSDNSSLDKLTFMSFNIRYYNNEDNEGHIFFQIINLSPVPIILKKGDAIGQGIIKEYQKVEGDIAKGVRKGGLGSTDEQVLASAT